MDIYFVTGTVTALAVLMAELLYTEAHTDNMILCRLYCTLGLLATRQRRFYGKDILSACDLEWQKGNKEEEKERAENGRFEKGGAQSFLNIFFP